MNELHFGDCLGVLPTLAAESIDALVTDPPAGIAFMGKEWDNPFNAERLARMAEQESRRSSLGPHSPSRPGRTQARTSSAFGDPAHHAGTIDRSPSGRRAFIVFLTAIAEECYRVMKPGAHGLVWAIPRTSHWTATALEDAGFEVRDRIAHLFAQGFPKSKNLDGEWQGWGTSLKPAVEDWWLIRKPLAAPNVASQVLATGTGALNIRATKISHASNGDLAASQAKNPGRSDLVTSGTYGGDRPQQSVDITGRWPANLVLSHSEGCRPVGVRKVQSGVAGPQSGGFGGGMFGDGTPDRIGGTFADPDGTETVIAYECAEGCSVAELGSEARFFYTAKASTSERSAGLHRPGDRNVHPTVKPTDLMRWLCRLVTPPGGVILDPFMGSGSTGVAARLEGFGFVGIEKDSESFATAEKRLGWAVHEPELF